MRRFPSIIHGVGAACAALSLTVHPEVAQAFDSCKVVLCLAGPWRSISQCRPDVTEFLRCHARGRCSLNCKDSGTSLSAASPANCPPQYGVYETDINGQPRMVGCAKSGSIDVNSQGVDKWVRVWWTWGGDEAPVFEYSPAAKAMLGEHVDPRFDDDYARWVAMQPPPGSVQSERGD